MRHQLDWQCDQHSDPFECVDALIDTFSDGRVGLIIHDGGSSMALISHCPWCGTPTGTSLTRTIYVRLLDEGVDVWRPVEAEEEEHGAFRLPTSAPEDEAWEFRPGSRVICEYRRGELAATRLAKR